MIRIERKRRKDLSTQKCWWLHQVISNNIVVTNIVKFRSLLLILNKIYFRVCNYNQLVCLHIKTFDISTLCPTIISISQFEDILQKSISKFVSMNMIHNCASTTKKVVIK